MHHSLNTQLLYCQASGTHGLGVFARQAIARDAFVIECQGILRNTDEITADTRALQIGPDLYLAEDPLHPCLDDFINHSCQPNLGFIDGSPKLYALRDIDTDEELFWDYRTSINEAGWQVACYCGTSLCDGIIQSYCDLPQATQARLQPWLLKYLR